MTIKLGFTFLFVAALGLWCWMKPSTVFNASTNTIEQSAKSTNRSRNTLSVEPNVSKGIPDHLRHLQTAVISKWDSKNYQDASTLFEQWLSEDPETALNFVASLPEHMQAAHFAPEIKRHFDDLPPTEAMQTTLKFEFNHQLQESISADSFARWLAEDQENALDWLIKHRKHAFTESLAERMGRLGYFDEPSAALAKILSYDDHPIRSHLVKGVLMKWLYDDTQAAVDFMNQSEPSSGFDDTLATFAIQFIEGDPVIAKVWAESIENESIRSMIIAQIDHKWTKEQQLEYQALTIGH